MRQMVMSNQHERRGASGKDFTPFLNEALVFGAYFSFLALQVEEAHRMDAVVLHAQGNVPVDLVREAIPGEAHDRHAVLAQAQKRIPFFPQPLQPLRFAAESTHCVIPRAVLAV